jgi:FRG domain protein
MSKGIESNSTNAVAAPSMQVEEVRINSVSEFIEKIVQLDKEEGTEIFYRGHADRDWELLPSIFRTPNGVEKEHLLFRDMVAHEPQSFSECKSALDYLVQMQHYGLPTRLLDMTTNPLVALYFACQSVGDVNAGISAGMQIAGEHVLGIILNDPRARDFTRKEANLMIRIAYMAGALAGASSATALHAAGGALAALLDEPMTDSSVLNVALFVADSSAKLGAEEGVKARAKDGVIYSFTAPENRVKHYDSDAVSVLTNLAKCKISEQCSASTPSVEDFNKQPDIARLCEQIKVEKPHFLPSIQPDTLSSLFFVKTKNGNQRITNQMGAF